MEDPFMKQLKKIHSSNTPQLETAQSSFDITSFTKNNIQSIREAIEEIKTQVEDRDELKVTLIRSLDSISSDINNLKSQKAAELEISQELALIKEQRDIEKLKLEEELNAWRDKAKLKEELREHLKELRDLELKSQELEKLIQ